MIQLPFQIRISNCRLKGRFETLECTKLLRSIASVRDVYEADWRQSTGDIPVVLKIFSKSLFSNRRIKREWKGLNLLGKLGITAPQPLFYGKTEDGRAAIAIEKIPDSSTALDIFERSENEDERLKLLILVCRQLARQNSRGVLQKDLHLGNFLISNDRVFAIDPAQMRFFSVALNKKQSTSQLAALCCCLYLCHTEGEQKIKIVYISRLMKEYYDERGWKIERSDAELLIKKAAASRKLQIKRGLRKLLRAGKRQLKIKTDDFLAVFDRSFAENVDIQDFILKIDSLMDSGRILKRGNTCYVSRLSFNDSDIVIKRYNYKGFIYSIRNTLKGSRARRSWLFGHLLQMLDVPTPKPLAFVEVRCGLIVLRSYIITKFVEGIKLESFLQSLDISSQNHSKIKQKFMELLDKLAFYRVTHGDLKHTNILVDDDTLILTDLDSMRLHKSGLTYRLARARDLRIFARGKRKGHIIFDDLS